MNTGKKIALAALVTTAIGSAVAVVPSYAQEAVAPAAAAPAAGPTVVAIGQRGMAIAHLRGGPGGDHAGLPIGRLDNLMETFDTDGNGTVTQAEIDAVRAGELAEYDANGDGQLNLEEYTAYWTAKMLERIVDAFQELDANGDGNVTTAEWSAGLENIVVRLDQDGDGALGPTDRPMHDEMQRPDRAGPGGEGGPNIMIRPFNR